MTFASFENIFTLFCTIIGLLGCLFKYIEVPKRTCLYLVFFFLAHFLSDYYWTIYVLVMKSYPEVSGFMANLGWNISYVFLLLAMCNYLLERKKRFFHPLMLWPVLTNVPQFILYLQFGGVLNNLWQVSITTAVMVLCMAEILFYLPNRKISSIHFPYLAVLILVYEILSYAMWTFSCFDWKSDLLNPYFYSSLLTSTTSLFFVHAFSKEQKAKLPAKIDKNATELRFQATIQTILASVIFTLCIGGYLAAFWLKDSLVLANSSSNSSRKIVFLLFTISFVLVLLILSLLFFFHRSIKKRKHEKNSMINRSRFNLVFTIIFTIILMMFTVVYNTRKYYDAAVTGVFEDGEDKVKMTAAHLENYLIIAESTLQVAADSIEMMEENGEPVQNILYYLKSQTIKQQEQTGEDFTGYYAYIDGQYLDGFGWDPPDNFNPATRDWYIAAAKGGRKAVMVSPFVDADTGSIVVTITKRISSAKALNNITHSSERAGRQGAYNVVCLDIVIDQIKELMEQTKIAGKGYGMIVTNNGSIVTHQNEEYISRNISDIYGPELLEQISSSENGRIDAVLDEHKCTLFICPIMDQWYELLVIDNSELFEDVYSQILTNIFISLIIVCLISFFYYLSYKNEQAYGKKVEEMNTEVVTALATAIDAKDKYTNGHSLRVAVYARTIASRAGYNEAKQDEIFMMGLLHDVGKIGVPDEVINKTSKLTDDEFNLIKKHPVIGNDILKSIRGRSKLSVGARWHHEKYNGSGYPDGLAGNDIPEEAKIIAIADAYDAMTSNRSYRNFMPQEKVRDEIEKGKGTQFDPKYAEIMVQMIDEDKDYIMREG